VENQVIAKMLSNLNDYGVEFVINTLEIEKQYANEKGVVLFLLENVDISTLLIQSIEKDIYVVSTTNSLLTGISNVRGLSSDVLKKILSDNSGAFVRFIIDSLKHSEVTSDVVQLLLGFIFPVIEEVKNDQVFTDSMNSVLLTCKNAILLLIKSGSVLKCYYGVQLYSAIASYSVNLLEKELLWDCLDVLFKYPYSSALHCLVSNTIVFMFDKGVEDIINMLLDNNEKFIDRIINEYTNKEEKKNHKQILPSLGNDN